MTVHSTKTAPLKRAVIFALICFGIIITVGPIVDYNQRQETQALLEGESVPGVVEAVEENTPTVPGQEKRGPGRDTTYDIVVRTADGQVFEQSTKREDTFTVGDRVQVYDSQPDNATAFVNERTGHNTLTESNKTWTIGWIVAAGISLLTIPVFAISLRQRVSRRERLEQQKAYWDSLH